MTSTYLSLEPFDSGATVMLPARPLNRVAHAPDQLALLRQLVLDPVYQLK